MYTTGRFAQQARQVWAENQSMTKANTAKAYDPKVIEFKSFCDAVFVDLPVETRCTVTEEKTFAFLYYQAYRTVRKRGRKRDGELSFDIDEYQRIIDCGRQSEEDDTEGNKCIIHQNFHISKIMWIRYYKSVSLQYPEALEAPG